MNCADSICRVVKCDPKDDIASYVSQYNLDNPPPAPKKPEICQLVTCPATDSIPEYVSQYNLDNPPPAPQKPEICQLVTCPDTDSINVYTGNFSLQSGWTFVNALISVPVPYGSGYYYIPPGTITINVPPNGGTVSYQGCQSTVSANVPSGSTQAAMQAIINGMMNQIAVQLSQCNAPPPTNPGLAPGGRLFIGTRSSSPGVRTSK